MTETVYCVAMIFLAIFCFCAGYMIGENSQKAMDRIEKLEKKLKEEEKDE